MTAEPFDLNRIRQTRLADRPSKVSVAQWARAAEPPPGIGDLLASLPDLGAARDLREVARRIAAAHRNGRPVVLAYGAHLVKVGLSPIVADMVARGVVTATATNGAGAIHDLEFALAGATSENVDEHLHAGTFGMARETAEAYNAAAVRAAGEDLGLGQALGEAILEANPGRGAQTVPGACARKGVFARVFVALGTDIVHMHPCCDGAALGASSHRDFRSLCTVVADLAGGVFLNVGSAVLLPEVFLKAVSVAINTGADLGGMTTVNMDFIHHYRPGTNVVRRPPGDGFHITGHHEIMLPLLRFAVLHELESAG